MRDKQAPLLMSIYTWTSILLHRCTLQSSYVDVGQASRADLAMCSFIWVWYDKNHRLAKYYVSSPP